MQQLLNHCKHSQLMLPYPNQGIQVISMSYFTYICLAVIRVTLCREYPRNCFGLLGMIFHYRLYATAIKLHAESEFPGHHAKSLLGSPSHAAVITDAFLSSLNSKYRMGMG